MIYTLVSWRFLLFRLMAVSSTLVLNQIDESARGPTDYSNWVIPKLLLASAYPAKKDSHAHQLLTRKIFNVGVQVIVNLMEAEELKTFTPYRETMSQYAKEEGRHIEFISFPIRDSSVNQDNHCVLDFCLQICDRIKQGKLVLVHCWGGHGRTGTIISIIIGILFNLNSEEAISMNRRLHDQRVFTNGIPSPETQPQIDQIRTVLDEIYCKNNEKA